MLMHPNHSAPRSGPSQVMRLSLVNALATFLALTVLTLANGLALLALMVLALAPAPLPLFCLLVCRLELLLLPLLPLLCQTLLQNSCRGYKTGLQMEHWQTEMLQDTSWPGAGGVMVCSWSISAPMAEPPLKKYSNLPKQHSCRSCQMKPMTVACLSKSQLGNVQWMYAPLSLCECQNQNRAHIDLV